MRVKEGFKMRSLLGEHIITAEGAGNVNFNKIISMNSAAAYLWDKIAGLDFNENKLVDMLLDEYDVTRERAEADVMNFVKSMRDAGLLAD